MKKARLLVFLILVATASCTFLGTSGAYFTHSETTPGITISTGSWVEPPHICGVIPCSGFSGCCAHVVVLGGDFAQGAKVELIRGETTIQAGNVLVACSSSIYCRFDLTGADPGFWDVRVTNPDGGNVTLKKGFLVIGFPVPRAPDEPEAHGTPVTEIESPDGVPPSSGEAAPEETPNEDGTGEEPELPVPPPQDPEKPIADDEGAADLPPNQESDRLDFQPRSGKVGEFVNYVVTGYAFVPGTVVILRKGDGLLMSLNAEIRDRELEGWLHLGGVWPGTWEIFLKLPDGTLVPISGSFTVYE